ncbi:Protein_Associated_with_Differentiation_-_putative [Leishmania infantum]|uniref:Protein_Associated_with_Differentiation_-_putative n=1 Tax=Leishmania infantum TaxID=5671 RepID=A0A6L0WNK1_LEIIN|nr:Protein_Associated_with_Differentiation_-_putative [Leishmania infantum]SUZ40223.1 Protein_Associated_with_Differentiation_-_putative [Leishmania infantum]
MFDIREKEVHLEVLSKAPVRSISETHRFGLLVLGVFGMICGSFGSYTFNLVSGSLQERYSLSQRDLSTITTAGTVIGNVMLPYSFLYDYIGPLPIAVLSSFVFSLGALLVALCFQGVIVGNLVKLCVFYSFMNVGTSFFDLSSCITILSYFPTTRGPVVALLKTFIGLGAAIVGSMFQGFFGGAVQYFFYFLMLFAIIVGVLGIIFLRLPAYHLTGYEESHLSKAEKEQRLASKAQFLKQKPPMWRFYYGFVLMVVLIGFLPLTAALVDYLDLGRKEKLTFATITTIFAAGFVVIAIPPEVFHCPRRISPAHEDFETLEKGETMPHNNSNDADKPLPFPSPAVAEEDVDTEIDYIAPQYQTSFVKNLLSVHLWALWWTSFCIVGAEDVIINNSSYIFGALAGEKTSTSTRTLLTVLNGVGSATGRLLMSYFEAWSQNRPAEKRIPLTISLFIPTTSIIVTIVLFLTLPKQALPLPYVIAAIGNGFLAATTILITRTIYARDPAKHYHFCFLAAAASSIALNRFLYGEWYTVQSEKLGNSLLCTHRKCVEMPLIVLLGLSCSAFVSNVVVHFTYRRYSERVLAERRRLREENFPNSEPLDEGTPETTL